jgi:hypothetical protein
VWGWGGRVGPEVAVAGLGTKVRRGSGDGRGG